MKKLYLVLTLVLITGCSAKDIDMKYPEFNKSPCACNEMDWPTRGQDNA